MKRYASLFTVLLAAATLHATTVIPMSIEQLTRTSTQVVEATAVSSRSQWNPEHTLIFTYTQFAVQRALKGQSPGTLVVRQLGGTVDGITQKVAGIRHWQPGEEAVLFLRPSSIADGAMVVTGLMQGDFLVRHGANGTRYVSNGMPGMRQYQATGETVLPSRGGMMHLDELESRIQKAVGQ